MNSVSKFAIALAVATAKLAVLDTVLISGQEAVSEGELFAICQSGNAEACSTFLELFPESPLAPSVVSLRVASLESALDNPSIEWNRDYPDPDPVGDGSTIY